MSGPDDERSPWLRDDWGGDLDAAPSTGAAEATTPPTERSDKAPRSQVVIAALVGAALLGTGLVAVVRGDDGATTAPAAPAGASVTTAAAPSPSSTAPVTIVDATPSSAPPATSVVDETVEPAALVPGQRVTWTESTVDVPSEIADLAPTEVVLLTAAGLLYRIELPSGRVRSIDVSDVDTTGSNLAIDDQSIVVHDANTVYRIDDVGPAVATGLPAGIVFVQSRPGTGEFVLVSPTVSDTDAEQEWLLDTDGSIRPIGGGRLGDDRYAPRTFSPFGDVLVNRPGGVYAIDPERGTAVRLGGGDLIGTGANHYAVEECDEALRCRVVVIDWSTGEVLFDAGSVLTSDAFLDPSTRLSPDGSKLVRRGTVRATDGRRVVDLRTGAVLQVGQVNEIVHDDSWSADGAGIFRDDTGRLSFVDVASGDVVEIGDFTDVTTIATRPLRTPSG